MTHYDSTPKPGQFIVKLPSQTLSHLTATDVLSVLEEHKDVQNIQIQRIHRVDHAGRLELIGVSKDLFTIQDGFVFSWKEEQRAKQDYDRIIEAAETNPPACEIEIERSTIDGAAQPHVVALAFPAACTETIGQWLSALDFRPGDGVSGGSPAIFAHQSSARDIHDRQTLAPSIDNGG